MKAGSRFFTRWVKQVKVVQSFSVHGDNMKIDGNIFVDENEIRKILYNSFNSNHELQNQIIEFVVSKASDKVADMLNENKTLKALINKDYPKVNYIEEHLRKIVYSKEFSDILEAYIKKIVRKIVKNKLKRLLYANKKTA
jgi:hypothetical protein